MASSTIKVIMPGKGEVSLCPTDHIATGGEGAVYQKNGTIFKLFLNPERAEANGMADKIKLLSRIQHPFIVAPIDLLYDTKHRLAGYYMPPAEGVPLVKTFTNVWRDQNAFTDAQSVQLVENMRKAVGTAHSLQAVIVDGNETNYLAQGVEPRLIDVDSWQIGNHPATAIMPSIRDYHATKHDELSDWFAWGIVSFQVFTGIHPYKGTHPDFRKGDLEARMRANASVFDPKIRLNAAVRDFSCIPKPLLDWYAGVFARGERSAPPSALLSQAPAPLTKKMIVRQSTGGVVRHDRVHGFSGAIRHVSANGVLFYAEADTTAPDGRRYKAFDLYRKQAIPALSSEDINKLFSNQAGLLRQGEGFVLLTTDGVSLSGRLIPGERDPQPLQTALNALPLATTKILVLGNRAFTLNPNSDNGLVELDATSLGSRTVLAVKTAWPVNVQSTRFFDGFGVMDCLGMPFIVLPQQDTLTILKSSSLAGFKLINGMGRGNTVWVHGVNRTDGQIYRMELRAGDKEFALVNSEVVDESELNLAVSAKGIAVGIFEDSVITVSNTQGNSVRTVADAGVGKEMHLFSLPDGMYYYRAQDVYKISLSA